jgi:threonine dehydrogenase-like Zn-dependent dehydrogenase
MVNLNATMRAVLWTGIPYNVSVQDIPRPNIQNPTDVLVRMTAAAICGTDLHTYHGLYGSTDPPWVMGHEGLGIVEQIGDAIQTLRVGDHVIIPDTLDIGHLNMDLAKPEASFGNSMGLGPDFGDYYGCQGERIIKWWTP